MDKVAIDDVRSEVNPMEVHDVRKPVSKVLGTEHFAMNYFELAPGDSFSGGLHTHHDQEEVFYVESGTTEFDVGQDGEETVTVDEGELIRFEPGEFQTGGVPEDADGTAVGWALGAPGAQHDWDDLESMVYCQDCDEEVPHGVDLTDEGRFEMTCSACGNEFKV
jgi:quercetin dioxygenase-like cupin family protein